jgi:APA family basic amino acid/polyamine antiporter
MQKHVVVPILGILICSALIFSLDSNTLKAAFSWMIVGLVIYFVYSRHNSLLKKQQ